MIRLYFTPTVNTVKMHNFLFHIAPQSDDSHNIYETFRNVIYIYIYTYIYLYIHICICLHISRSRKRMAEPC